MTTMVRAANPIWYMVDHTGLSLNDEYYAFFLTNTLPYIPQNVYRDNQGLTVWTGNIVQFQPSGTLPNNLYFNPSLVYRIEIRHGNTQADELIWEINNFVPGIDSVSPDAINDFLDQDNQISNPQFNEIDFTSPFTYTEALSATYTVQVAPGWELVLTGTGTTILTQIEISGVDSSGVVPPIIRGNPPYALKINNNGWTTALLRQRFNNNGAIFTNGSIAMSITARATTTPIDITLNYNPSSPGTPEEIAQGSIAAGSFSVLNGAITLPASTNTSVGDNAYVDMEIIMPGTCILDITNIQVVGDSYPLSAGFNPLQDIPAFREQTIQRETDYLFHYYINSILAQPKQSLLAGWIFALNPWQFRLPASANVATNTYTADQTIMIQQAYVASLTGDNVAVGRGSAANNYSYGVTAVTANNQFGIVQFVDSSIIRPYWGGNLSCFVKAKIVTSNGSTVKIKARLIYRVDAPAVVSQNAPIQSWAAGGDPVVSAGWIAVKPLNDQVHTLTSTSDGVSFNKFQLPASSADAMMIGLMIYTTGNMTETGTPDVIYIDKVSLVPNDFAIETVETYDESLRKCQFYFEHSYDVSQLAAGTGVVTDDGVRFTKNDYIENGGSTSMKRRPFGSDFMQEKSRVPILRIYSPKSTGADNVSIVLRDSNGGSEINRTSSAVSSAYTIFSASKTNFYYIAKISAEVFAFAGVNIQQYYVQTEFHYEADARLGVV